MPVTITHPSVFCGTEPGVEGCPLLWCHEFQRAQERQHIGGQIPSSIELSRYGVRRYPQHDSQLVLRQTKDFQSGAVRRVVAHARHLHRFADQRNVDYEIAQRIDVTYNPVWLTGSDYVMPRKPSPTDNFAVDHPDLISHWHIEKNGTLNPHDLLSGSSTKAWWICSSNHEYQRSPYNQIKAKGKCPFCSGRFPTQETCLEAKNPSVARQWHPTKNGDLLPSDLLPLSNRLIWWICDFGHEYEATVCHRTLGTGCPCCSGRKASEQDNLLTRFPEIASEWHPTKNGALFSSDVRHGSEHDAWWLCVNGHSYQTRVYLRAHGAKCPECRLQKLKTEDSVGARSPSLTAEWHPYKNGKLTPYQLRVCSKTVVWWACGKGHEYEASPISRRTTGCPFCAGWKLAKGASLADLFPEIASEWHPTKNGDKSPLDVRPRSSESAWWLCPKGHTFQCLVRNRTKLKVNCGFCRGVQVNETNNIPAFMPHVMPEWDYERNIGIDPRQIYYRNKTLGIWWKCQQGHSWRINASYRSKGSRCPHCSPKTSRMEIYAYCEFKHIFHSAEWRARVEGMEADILIPDIRVVIEIDGAYWHKSRIHKDYDKNKKFRELGFTVFRIREHDLPMLSDRDVPCAVASCDPSVISKVIAKIQEHIECSDIVQRRIRQYILDEEQKNSVLFEKMTESMRMGKEILRNSPIYQKGEAF